MKELVNWVSEGFIWGVGITRPTPDKQRQAAIYITVTLICSVAFACALFFFLVGKIK
jgi:hypothetical protein